MQWKQTNESHHDSYVLESSFMCLLCDTSEMFCFSCVHYILLISVRAWLSSGLFWIGPLVLKWIHARWVCIGFPHVCFRVESNIFDLWSRSALIWSTTSLLMLILTWSSGSGICNDVINPHWIQFPRQSQYKNKHFCYQFTFFQSLFSF